jgi:hypothetical protein
VIERYDEPDRRRLFFWRDVLGDRHFDFRLCRKDTLEPLLAVDLDDPAVPKRSTTSDDAKATAARNATFPLVHFSAAANLTPDLVLISGCGLARTEPLPQVSSSLISAGQFSRVPG